MQTWFVQSKHLGLLKISYDPSKYGFLRNGEVKLGAITHLEIMQSGKPIKSDSLEQTAFETLLRSYEAGNLQAFDEVSVELAGTNFQNAVLTNMRRISVGSVSTYGDLARKVGSPNAYRAVASVCATNKVPLVIPCHRVVPSDYSIGNYASRHLKNGSKLKEALLKHEGAID